MPEVCPPADYKPVAVEREQLLPPEQWEEGVCYEFPVRSEVGASLKRPVDFQLRWLRENVRGMVRDPLPFRFDSRVVARIELSYRGVILGRAWREADRIALEYAASPEPAIVTVQVAPWQHPEPDPLLGSLLGIHSLEWFRENTVKGGTWQWSYTLEKQQVPVAMLQALGTDWAKLDLEREARAWASFSGDGAEARAVFGGDEALYQLAKNIYEYSLTLEDSSTWPKWAWKRVGEFLGDDAERRFASWCQFKNRIHEAASEALALMLRSRPAAGTLASRTFPLDGNTESEWRQALNGDLGVMKTLVEERPRIEIDMPFRSRHEVRMVSDKLEAIQIAVEPIGRVVVYQPDIPSLKSGDLERTVLIPFTAEYSHGGERWDTAGDCVFRYTREVETLNEWASWTDILGSFGIQAPIWDEEPALAELSVTLPGSAFAAWLNTPPPREAIFGEAFGQVGERLQIMMRAWLPALWFSDIERFRNVDEAYPMLAYAATPLAQSCGEPTYTFDATRAGVMYKIREAIRNSGVAILERVQHRLRLAGHEDLLPLYAPQKVRELAIRAQRKGTKEYELLLRREAKLMEELLRIPTKVRELRLVMKTEPAHTGRTISRIAGEIVRALRKQMSGRYLDEGGPPLEQLLVMEAACALAGQKLHDKARVEFALERSAGRQVWRR